MDHKTGARLLPTTYYYYQVGYKEDELLEHAKD